MACVCKDGWLVISKPLQVCAVKWYHHYKINKLLNKLPLILLCTIRIDDSLFNCHVLPQQGCDGATGQGTWVPCPFGYNTEIPRSFRKASSRLRVQPLTQVGCWVLWHVSVWFAKALIGSESSCDGSWMWSFGGETIDQRLQVPLRECVILMCALMHTVLSNLLLYGYYT